MLLLVTNRILTLNREKTYLTAAVAAAGTTLTVKAVDTNAWADNDWVIVGEIGTPNAEILQINGAVSDGTSLTVDNAGSGGARYAHSIDEPVYRIDYNKVRFFRGTTTDGAASTTLATNEIQPDDFETRYEDTANDSGYGFARFFNSFTNALSPFSDSIPYTGMEDTSLAMMMEKVRTLCDEQESYFLSDQEIADGINDIQHDIIKERLWTFNECEFSASSVANQLDYDIPTLIKTLYSVRFRTQPLRRMTQAQWEIMYWNTQNSASVPTSVAQWNNKIRLYPRPSGSAATTTLNGGTTATATTITVVATTNFKIGDYYRFIVDSEVIYATGATSTTFTGCLRGQEGTTAAAHLTAATVTERDIVFTGQKKAVNLVAQNDVSVVPDNMTICTGVASNFCNGKLNKPTLGDRWQKKYEEGLRDLRNEFTLKLESQFAVIKDPRQVLSDKATIVNPNNYPSNVQAS